jgi:hypothetical protein
MFKGTDILKFISSKRRPQNFLTVFFPENSANFPTKKYILFFYVISAIAMLRSVFMQYMAYFCLFYLYDVNGISRKTELIY